MTYMELLIATIVKCQRPDSDKVEMLGIVLDMQNALLSQTHEAAQRVLSRLTQEVE